MSPIELSWRAKKIVKGSRQKNRYFTVRLIFTVESGDPPEAGKKRENQFSNTVQQTPLMLGVKKVHFFAIYVKRPIKSQCSTFQTLKTDKIFLLAATKA